MRSLLAVAAALLLTAACGEQARVEARVLDYALVDQSTLQVYVDACNANVNLQELRETPAEVRLTVTADKPGRSGDDCADGFEVPLSVPLGSRTVIDASTDKRVPAQGE